MKNYFLVYRPFHLNYVLSIIENKFSIGNNIVIDHFNTKMISPSNNTVEHILIDGSITNKMSRLLNIKKRMLLDVQKGKSINVFFPHTLGLLSNYAYYQLKNRYPQIKLNLYYEGVLFFKDNYVHKIIPNLHYYVSRVVVGLLLGICYRVNSRICNLEDNRISQIYSPLNPLKTNCSKLVLSQFLKIRYEIKRGCCLILGHAIPYSSSIQESVIRSVFLRVLNYQISYIYFKDHPFDKCIKFIELANEIGVELVVLNRFESAEDIVSKINPEYIFSPWSSSLINLRAIVPESVDIECFVNEEIVKKEGLADLLGLFTKQNIVINYV